MKMFGAIVKFFAFQVTFHTAVQMHQALCLKTVTLECESQSRERARCQVISEGTLSSIELTEQLSRSSCDLGDTYGLTSNLKAIWVDDGCRAVFRVTVAEETTSAATTTTTTTTTTTQRATTTTQRATTTTTTTQRATTTTKPVTSTSPSVTSTTEASDSTDPCVCDYGVQTSEPWNVTMVEVEKLRSLLLLNVTSLSSHRRRYNSAEDNRTSVVATGVAGISIIVIVGFLILVSDLTSLFCTCRCRDVKLQQLTNHEC